MDNTAHIEKNIGIAMRVGVIIASAFMLFGFVLLLIFWEQNFASFEVFSLDKVFEGLLSLNPYSFMYLGLLLLILTPVLRVVTSIILFAKERDKLYTAITILVLLILIASFFVGYFIY